MLLDILMQLSIVLKLKILYKLKVINVQLLIFEMINLENYTL